MFQELDLIGYLGKDPEMRFLPSGTQVTNFSLATTHSQKSQGGEWVKKTTWFKIAVFGAHAEACNEYLKKGSQVRVSGRLVTDEHGNPKVFQKQDGTWASSFEVMANNVLFLGKKGETNGSEDSPGEDDYAF